MSERIPFVDLHAHFPMHSPFPPKPFEHPRDNWKRGLFAAANRLLNFENGHPRVSLQRWFEDDPQKRVSGFGSVLYDPEDEFLVDTGPIPIPSAFGHICAQLANVEREISDDGRVVVARTPNEVARCVSDNVPFIFHVLEGGFSLGGNPSRVRTLARLGVASIVPAHLLYRGVATCENGFPPAAYALFKDELARQPALGLSSLGRELIEECFRNGIVVDVTHARDDAQRDIFEIAAGYPTRPVISSHNSLRSISPAGLNLSDETVFRIKATNGVVGVIFYRHWLRRSMMDWRPDLQLLTDVIDRVVALTSSYDYIAIGSDLDGFIDPIQICSNYSKMSTLVRPLLARYGQTAAEKILYRNALRVLQSGWAGGQPPYEAEGTQANIVDYAVGGDS